MFSFSFKEAIMLFQSTLDMYLCSNLSQLSGAWLMFIECLLCQDLYAY